MKMTTTHTTTESNTPMCWALFNPATGKINTTRVYVGKKAALAGSVKHSNRWRQFVAVPLFLHPSVYEAEK